MKKKERKERGEDNCCLSDCSKMKFSLNHIKNKKNRQFISYSNITAGANRQSQNSLRYSEESYR